MADEINQSSNDTIDAHDEENTEESSDQPAVTDEVETSTRNEEDVAYSALEAEADAFTRFIERQRMDVMFELRRLRLGDRPVSGQSNRDRIQTFLTNIQEQQQQPRRVPSRREPPPSAHRADIDALTSRRCVTAALGSSAFRRDLENTIRHTIGSISAPTVPSTITQVPPAVSQNSQILPTESRTGQVLPPAPPMPQENVATQPRVAQILNLQERENELNAWGAIGQLQQERIIMDISDLVHRQLVTTALESDFRQHLERNVLYRLERGALISDDPTPTIRSAPTQAQAVAAAPTAAASSPPSLPLRAPQNNGTRVTGTVTAPRGGRVMLSDLDSLTSRLDAMQDMLQLMYSMQLDMQRSIRQEVASALANSTTAPPKLADQTVDAGNCTVCLMATADTVIYRCGHLCVCYTCGMHLRQARTFELRKCPVCRAPIEDILRVYQSSQNLE